MLRGRRRSALLVTGLYLFAVSIASLVTAGVILPPELQLFGAAHQGQNAPSDLFFIDPLDGSPLFIGPIGFNTVGAMDFDPRTGTLYATGRRPSDELPVLITINRFTGEGTEVGPLVDIVLGDNPFDISFGKTDGVLYATAFGAVGTSLYSIDTTTGLATEIGDTTTNEPGNGFSLDGVDNAYFTTSVAGGTLFSVDLTTGVASPAAPIIYVGFPVLSSPRVNAIELEQGFNFVSVNDGQQGGGPNYLGILPLSNLPPIGPRSSGVEGGVAGLGSVFNLGQTVNGLDALAVLPAPRLFGAAHFGIGSPSTLFSVNVFWGTATPIGEIGFNSVGGMDFDPFSGILYGTGLRPGDSEKVLITIDPLTGVGVEVGPLVNNLGNNSFDISFRNSDGTLFLTGIGDDCIELFTVDTETGLATPVGPTSTCSPGNGLAMTPADTLHHVDSAANGTLYEVNQATGESTTMVRLNFLGPPMLEPRVNAMEFVPGFNIVSINTSSAPAPGEGVPPGPNYLGIVYLPDIAPLGLAEEDGVIITPLPGDVFIGGQTVDGLDALAVMPTTFVYGAAHVDSSDFASTLYRIDPHTGAYNDVGPIGFDNVNGLDFEPGTGKLFGIGERSSDNEQVTIRVDPITGQGFEVGPLVNASFGINDHDISFRRSDAELFIASFGSTCIDLFTIDTASGLASEIGSTSTCAPSNALGFDVHDNLFHLDNGGIGPGPGDGGGASGSLQELDQLTGAATPVAPLTYLNFPLLNFPIIDAMELTPGLQLVSVNDDTAGPGDGGGPLTNIDYLASIVTSNPAIPPPGTEVEEGLFSFAGEVTFIGQTITFLDSIATVTEASDNQITSDLLFADGFESGDTSAWSSTVPPMP